MRFLIVPVVFILGSNPPTTNSTVGEPPVLGTPIGDDPSTTPASEVKATDQPLGGAADSSATAPREDGVKDVTPIGDDPSTTPASEVKSDDEEEHPRWFNPIFEVKSKFGRAFGLMFLDSYLEQANRINLAVRANPRLADLAEEYKRHFAATNGHGARYGDDASVHDNPYEGDNILDYLIKQELMDRGGHEVDNLRQLKRGEIDEETLKSAQEIDELIKQKRVMKEIGDLNIFPKDITEGVIRGYLDIEGLEEPVQENLGKLAQEWKFASPDEGRRLMRPIVENTLAILKSQEPEFHDDRSNHVREWIRRRLGKLRN